MAAGYESGIGKMSNKSTERKWDRGEVVILVVEYFRIKNLSYDETHQTHQEISDFPRQREEIPTGVLVSDIFRNYAGIHMQSGRILRRESIMKNSAGFPTVNI